MLFVYLLDRTWGEGVVDPSFYHVATTEYDLSMTVRKDHLIANNTRCYPRTGLTTFNVRCELGPRPAVRLCLALRYVDKHWDCAGSMHVLVFGSNNYAGMYQACDMCGALAVY